MTAGGMSIRVGGRDQPGDFVTLTNTVKSAARACGLHFDRATADTPHWYGVASPYFAIFAGFELRRKEIRVGTGKATLGINAAKQKVEYSLGQLGLLPSHYVLLEGITFPPKRRSAMIQTMGPLTILISLWKAHRDYVLKFKNAAKRTFNNWEEIDHALTIINQAS